MTLEVGPRDMAEDSVFFGRRDRDAKQKSSVKRAEIVDTMPALLQEMQDNLLAQAKAFRAEHTHEIETKADFYDFFTPKNKQKPEIHGGFAISHWAGTKEEEDALAKELKVSIRCIPFDSEETAGTCIYTGRPSTQKVIFAKSY